MSAATLEEGSAVTIRLLNLQNGDRLEYKNSTPGVTQSVDWTAMTWTLNGAASMFPADVTQTLTLYRGTTVIDLHLQLHLNGHKVLPPSYARRTANADERRMLTLVNTVRASGATCGGEAMAPAGPLAWDDTLFSAGLNHSQDQLARNYYDHVTPEGVTPTERDFLAGFRSIGASGENIYKMNYVNTDSSTADTDAAFKGWMASSGHCHNIMNPLFTLIGVAYHDGTPSSAAVSVTARMWSMELASHN